MKFDSFVKYAGGNGLIETAPDKSKWLFFDGIGMKVPEYKNVCGKEYTMPDYIDKLINEAEFREAELIDAHVPHADSKPSELLRTFGGRGLSIDITNKAFGFIEKKDRTLMAEYEGLDDDSSYIALLVTDDYDEDDPEIKMIITEKVED